MFISQDQIKQLIEKNPGVDANQLVQGFVNRGYQIEGLEIPTQTQNKPTTGDRFFESVQDIKETGMGIGRAFQTLKQRVGETSQMDSTFQEKALGQVGNVVGFGSDVLGEATKGLVKAQLSPGGEDKLKEGVASAIEPISPIIQKANEKLDEIEAQDPRTAQNLRSALRIIEGAFEVTGIGASKRVAQEGLETIIGVAKRIDDSSDSLRQYFRATKQATPDVFETQRKSVVDNIKTMVVGDQKTLNNKLEELARRNDKTVDDLIGELVDEGGLPSVNGTLASYDEFIRGVDDVNKQISQQINRRLYQIDNPTTLEELKNLANSNIKSSRATASNRNKMSRELDDIFDSFKSTYGDTLTPSNINEIRVEMNKKFKDAAVFELDTRTAIGNATRQKLQEFGIPEVVEGLAESKRLYEVKEIAEILDNAKINVNEYVASLGGFTGTVLAGAGGITAIAGGPAGLLIAAMAAKFGSKALAKAIRNRSFSPEKFNLIKQAFDENPKILDEIIKRADEADREILKTLD